MARYTFLIFCLLLALQGRSQFNGVPMDEQMNIPVHLTAADSLGNLYVAYDSKTIGFRTANLHVQKWNGLFWTKLPVLQLTEHLNDSAHQMEMVIYNGQVTVIGSFKSVNGINGVARWTGSQWAKNGSLNSNYFPHDEISVKATAIYDHKLFVVGDFNRADSAPVKNIAVFNGLVWNGLASGGAKRFDCLTTSGDDLYVSGRFSAVEGNVVKDLARFDGSAWSAVTHNFDTITELADFDGALAVITPDEVTFLNGSTWTKLTPASFSVTECESALFINGKLYLTGRFNLNGESNIRLVSIDRTSTDILLREGDLSEFDRAPLSLVTDHLTVYLTGGYRSLFGKPVYNIAQFKPGFTAVSGVVFEDMNGNCSMDAGEMPLTTMLIKVNDGSYYTSTDDMGRYTVFVPNNRTATIEIITGDEHIAKCGDYEQILTVGNADSIIHLNFPLELKPEAADLKMELTSSSGFVVKHGYTGTYYLDVSSANKHKFPLRVTLKHDKRLADFTSPLQVLSSSEDGQVWEVDRDEVIEVQFRIDHTRIEMNEVLNFDLEVQDRQKWTRSTQLDQVVVSAYDPNDKQCDKNEVYPGTDDLNYHIRFQNLGTASATDIHIVDTIDPNLPIEYIHILANSHFHENSTSYKVRDHAIIWSFKDIELPSQEIAGDAASSGFVSYRGGLKDSLVIGQEFRNTAYIYFDFQPPVVTNTVISRVVEEGVNPPVTTHALRLYPNPSLGMVQVVTNESAIQTIQVFTTNGKRVYDGAPEPGKYRTNINLTHLPVGLYVVRVEHALGVEVGKVILGKE